jgi:sorbitol-specific phosphotransferase system component IIBC
MKKILILLAISSSSFILNAQTTSNNGTSPASEIGVQNMNPVEKATHLTNRMVKSLGLSEEQKTKVMAVNLDAAQKMKSLRENNEIKGKEMHSERKKIEQEKELQLKGILSDDQFQRFIKEKQDMKQRMIEKRQKSNTN